MDLIQWSIQYMAIKKNQGIECEILCIGGNISFYGERR